MYAATKTHQETAIEALFRKHGQKCRAARKEIIGPVDGAPNCLYLVTKGAIRVALRSGPDDEIHVSFLHPGDTFGEQGLFDRRIASMSPATYRARSDVELLAVPHSIVARYAAADPQFYADLSSHIHSRLATATAKLAQMLFLDLETRCYDCLIDLTRLPDAMTHPDGMLIRLSRIELARMARCSRETAGRILNTLAAKSLLSVSGQSIVLNGVRYTNRPARTTPDLRGVEMRPKTH